MSQADDEIVALRNAFIDAFARSFAEGVASIPSASTEITNAIRDLAWTSQQLADALDARLDRLADRDYS